MFYLRNAKFFLEKREKTSLLFHSCPSTLTSSPDSRSHVSAPGLKRTLLFRRSGLKSTAELLSRHYGACRTWFRLVRRRKNELELYQHQQNSGDRLLKEEG